MSTEFFEKFKYKLKSQPELLEIIGTFPRKKKVIVCHGVFDVRSATPVFVRSSVSVGVALTGVTKLVVSWYNHMCVFLNNDKIIKCWGANLYGQLGNTGKLNLAAPVIVTVLNKLKVD